MKSQQLPSNKIFLIFMVSCAIFNCSLPNKKEYIGDKSGSNKSQKSAQNFSKGTYFPHPKEWVNPEIHGVFTVKNGGFEKCTGCHGGDLMGGGTGVNCGSCHKLIPEHQNKEKWTINFEHGRVFLADKNKCATRCHGEDLNGGISGVSCTMCHKNYPHQKGWGYPENHGKVAKGNVNISCATNCHGKNLTIKINDKNCFTCHKNTDFPDVSAKPTPQGYKPGKTHPPNWSEPEYHGVFAQNQKPNGFRGCAGLCHGTDLLSGYAKERGYDCGKCHDLLPAHLNKESWLLNAEHGSKYLENNANCATKCHGLNLAGGLTGVSCNMCHSGIYPHSTIKGWVDEAVHSEHVKIDSATGMGDFSSCALKFCHGRDLKREIIREENTTKKANCFTTCHSGLEQSPPFGKK